MQAIFHTKVSKHFPSYIPKIVEQIFVGVGGAEANGSVLADCQPIGSDSGTTQAKKRRGRTQEILYMKAKEWTCSSQQRQRALALPSE